jgi:hypothetical protein
MSGIGQKVKLAELVGTTISEQDFIHKMPVVHQLLQKGIELAYD